MRIDILACSREQTELKSIAVNHAKGKGKKIWHDRVVIASPYALMKAIKFKRLILSLCLFDLVASTLYPIQRCEEQDRRGADTRVR